MIYDGPPEDHLPGLARLAGAKLKSNYRCLYLHRPAIVQEMQSHLVKAGVDVSEQLHRGALILSSDQSQIVDGRFDVDRMIAAIELAARQAVDDGFVGLWASGDMMWEFGNEKNFSKLLEYEHRLESVFERNATLCGVCQYHAERLPSEVVQWGLYTHQAVFINETLSRSNPHYAPIRLLTDRKPSIPAMQMRSMFAAPRPPLHA